jgi:hypothetical protein
MSVIDDVVSRLQALSDAVVDAVINATPDYPTDDFSVQPMSIAHITEGDITQRTATDTMMMMTVDVDFHWPREDIAWTYKQIDKLIVEYCRRLGGDPTLDGAVDTIEYPVPFIVVFADWNDVQTQMVKFRVRFKELETPLTTST